MYGAVSSKMYKKLLNFVKTMDFLIQTGFASVVENIPRKLKDTVEFFKTFSHTFLIPPVKQIF